MIELIYSLVFFIFGFIVGWKYREHTAIKNINEMVHHFEKDTTIQIKIERVDGQIFVYNKATSEYMAHASNRTNLEKMLQEKFPGKSFGASAEDMVKLDESI